MCGNCFRIKVCNRFAPNKVAVKCGVCPECRKIEQNSWSFRLRCELETCARQGWKIGFVTLTYDNSNLPHIPEALVTSNPDNYDLRCFDKASVRDFVVKLRKSLYDDYSIGKNHDGIKYLLASEFGKSTARPHYHMVISWPPLIDSDSLLNLIRSKWSYGLVFPRYSQGGLDAHGYRHLPFEVTSNPFGCAKYISKYICKDLDFFRSLEKVSFCDDADLSNYFPFHIQSKSLGFSALKNLSDDLKLKYITDGYSFIGDDKVIPIPLYFKRKLLFSPSYIVERNVFQDSKLVDSSLYDDSLSDAVLQSLGFTVSYRRLVRREATDFFKRHYEVIYNKQHSLYTKLFERVLDIDFIVSRGVSRLNAVDFVNYINSSPLGNPSDLASSYLMFYGLPIDKCFDVEPSIQWFLRYDSDNSIDTSSFPFFRVSSDFYEELNNVVPILLNLATCSKVSESLSAKIAERVADFWKSANY